MPRTVAMAEAGIVGELYVPAGPGSPVCVVVVAGFSGGFSHRPIARALARDGFAALALAHFKAEGLPPRMENIPLEYFARAAEWLRSQPELKQHRLIVMGASRGAELALQVATLFPVYEGAILTSPSHLRFGAPGGRTAAWCLDGSPLPFFQPQGTPPPALPPRVIDGKSYSQSRSSAPHLSFDNPSVEAATIPVEDVHGPVLMFAGQDDDLWDSAFFADRIEARARRLATEHPVENVQYARVGHNIPLPGDPPVLHVWNAASGTGMSFGGEHEPTLAAAEDRWQRVKAFLRNPPR